MDDTIVAPEEIRIGPALSVLSPERLAVIKAEAKASVEAAEEMELKKTQVHQIKMQGVSERRRQRKAAGLAKREKERLAQIPLDRKERQRFVRRCNFMTPAMQEEIDRLDLSGIQSEIDGPPEAPAYQPSVGQASLEELQAELARRESLVGELPAQESASEPDIQRAMTPEEKFQKQDEDNAMEDLPLRARKPGKPSKTVASSK